MKHLTPFIFAAFLLAIFVFPSCKPAAPAEEESDSCCVALNTDSLIQQWNAAWDKKDSAALWNMIAEDAFVIDHDWTAEGRDSLFAKWITPSLPSISNIKTTALQTNVCCCCASITGFYTLDYTNKEGKVLPSRGNFLFIWNKADDDTWKLKTMLMTELHDKK